MFVRIVQTLELQHYDYNCTISVAFLEGCLFISEANGCLTSVNMKRNQETQT